MARIGPLPLLLAIALCGCADASTEPHAPRGVALMEPPSDWDAAVAADADAARDDAAPPDAVSYETVDLATGLLRTAVVKRDTRRGVCARVVLVHGAGAGRFAAWVSGQAAVEHAWLSRDLPGCASPIPAAPADAVLAEEVSGRVTLRARRDGRCFIDLDLTLTFASSEAWVPGEERLTVRGLDNSFACLVPRTE